MWATYVAPNHKHIHDHHCACFLCHPPWFLAQTLFICLSKSTNWPSWMRVLIWETWMHRSASFPRKLLSLWLNLFSTLMVMDKGCCITHKSCVYEKTISELSDQGWSCYQSLFFSCFSQWMRQDLQGTQTGRRIEWRDILPDKCNTAFIGNGVRLHEHS